ncbi:MAG: hypothetical protein WBX15_17760 [Thermoanaerobaculia bacterium]
MRRIVAGVCGRSVVGTTAGTRIRRDLGLTVDQEREIAWQLSNAFGIDLRAIEWADLVTIGDLLNRVDIAIERERFA